jgi:SAM-dependent methyltransferase
VYVAQRLSDWLATRPGSPIVADAGSGFTFFPFYLLQAHTGLRIDCLDNDPVAGEALLEAADILGTGLAYHVEDLESLNLGDETLDAVFSVSVIELTRNSRKVIEEIDRVLKPEGLFLCTFDVSFEVRSPMHVRHVAELVNQIEQVFDLASDYQPIAFQTLSAENTIVTTHWDSEAVKSGLPWRNPLLVWAYDALRGRYRRRLYRPMTFCCLAGTRKTR